MKKVNDPSDFKDPKTERFVSVVRDGSPNTGIAKKGRSD